MTILSKDVLCKHGPYIRFVDCPGWVDTNDPRNRKLSFLNEFIFYQMSDSLLGAFCSVTNTFSPFDCYDFTDFGTKHQIRSLASEFSMWIYQLLRSGDGVFTKQVKDYSFYDGSRRVRVDHELDGENLRQDMIDTLMMLVGKLSRIAREGNRLVIVGI